MSAAVRPATRADVLALAQLSRLWRQERHGTALDASLAHADRQGFAPVVLNPTPRWVAFYQRAGFGTDHPLPVRE